MRQKVDPRIRLSRSAILRNRCVARLATGLPRKRVAPPRSARTSAANRTGHFKAARLQVKCNRPPDTILNEMNRFRQPSADRFEVCGEGPGKQFSDAFVRILRDIEHAAAE